nr:hypothetical protein [Tanacetum cinerariifolium]
MSTRSSARNLFPPFDNPELTIRRRSRVDPTLLNDFEMAAEGTSDQPVPDLRTMKELCQPSLNARGDDANKHLDKFLHVTQSIKVNGVTDDALRLYLFSHSLTHHATAWFDRLPRNSINTFEQMAKMFFGKYFPPSIVTKLKNEITNFRQRPDESLFEAWERYKLSIDRCHNYNMLPVTEIYTFYNGLSLIHRDTINAAAGGTFMKRPLKAEMAEINKNLMIVLQVNQQVKAVTPNCETCGGPHSFNVVQPPLAKPITYMLREPIKGASHGQNPPPAYQSLGYQAPVHQPQIPQPQVVTTNEFTNFIKFMKMNTASSSGSGTLPGNTITNPKKDLKGITTRSGTAYQGPMIPTTSSSSSQVVERETEATKDTVHTTNNESTKDVQPLKLRDKANDQREKFFQIFKDLNFNISFADALILMPKFGSTIKTLLTYKDKMSELARTSLNEHCSAVLLKKLPEKLGDPGKFLIPCDFPRKAECLALADLSASINFMPLSVWNKLSLPDLSPVCMTLELADRSISRSVGVAEDVFVKVGTFHFPPDFVVIDFDFDPRVPLILGRSFLKTGRALIDVFEGELTLHEYSQEVIGFFDVIASSNPTPYYDLIVSTTSPTLTPFDESDFLLEEFDAFLALEDDPTSPEVDQSYEQKICEAKSDKSSIDEPPEVELKDLPPHLEYAFLEGDDKLPVIIAKDLSIEENTALKTVLKSHKRAIAWKLSDIKGIDPEFCIHKILMEEDFGPAVQHQRRVNPKIHDVIKNEVLKLLDAGLIYPIFDSPWRCMMAIFHDMIEKTMKVFMDDFLVFGNSFQTCLSHLEKMLKWCEGTNLCLNWEKSHFMVNEGIVLGHKISKNGIEVDKAKVEIISKLPHPTTVKGIRSFLGHVGFYRCFIKYFSNIAQPMTRLLEKDTSFLFSKECVEAFQTLKRKLTEAPILIAPDWDLPFELMCDASDFDIGAVLGKRQEKHFRPIYYASETMTEAESNYTTTEKEMLAVVYAFEKFQSYLIMNKSIVYTDHFALKYLFAKKDSKARLLRWVLILQEFTFKVIDIKRAKNMAADHLSRLENPHQNVLVPKEINESFPFETLNMVSSRDNSSKNKRENDKIKTKPDKNGKRNGDLPVPDLRTMEELCQPSLNGWGGPITPIAI